MQSKKDKSKGVIGHGKFEYNKFKLRDTVHIKMPAMDKLSSFQSMVLGWILRHN